MPYRLATPKIPRLPGEVWVEVKGYSGRYFISNKHRVCSKTKAGYRIIGTSSNIAGSIWVDLKSEGVIKRYYAWQLVADHFPTTTFLIQPEASDKDLQLELPLIP